MEVLLELLLKLVLKKPIVGVVLIALVTSFLSCTATGSALPVVCGVLIVSGSAACSPNTTSPRWAYRTAHPPNDP
jgi:hypothetical protein